MKLSQTTTRKIISPLLIFGIILILSGLFLRLFLIRDIPFSYYHDEIDYIFTGEAVARFGTDITDNWTPLKLEPLKTMNYNAELTPIFHAFFQKIFGYGPQSGHLPSAFFGIITAFLIGILTYLLTNRKSMGLITTGLILTNPWHVHISRLGYEAPISIAFQVLFLAGVILAVKKDLFRHQKIVSLAFIVLGYFFAFFTYFGAKFTQLTLAITALGLVWYNYRLKNLRWSSLLTFLLGLLIIGSVFYSLQISKQGLLGIRQNEILNLSYTTSQVDAMRKSSLDFPLKSLFVNKLTLTFNEIIRHYSFVFDSSRLFFNGMESGYQFSLIVSSFFYLSSLLFLLLGGFYLARKMRKTFVFLLIILIISPVSSIITTSFQSIFRSGLTYLILLIFMGIGLASSIEYLTRKKFRIIALSGLLLVLIIEVVWFGYNYFSRYPVLAADNHNFNQKLLSAYINRLNGPVTVITDIDTYSIARSFISYSGQMGLLSDKERAQFSDTSGNYFKVGDVIFLRNCQKYSELPENPIIIDPAKLQQCGYDDLIRKTLPVKQTDTKIKLMALGSPRDSGTYFYLFNDQLCNKKISSQFVYPTKLKQFDLFKLPTEEFCQTWIYPDYRNIPTPKIFP